MRRDLRSGEQEGRQTTLSQGMTGRRGALVSGEADLVSELDVLAVVQATVCSAHDGPGLAGHAAGQDECREAHACVVVRRAQSRLYSYVARLFAQTCGGYKTCMMGYIVYV